MTEPTNPAGSARSTILGGDGQADDTDTTQKVDRNKAAQIAKDDDSPLESIGKAITAPVRDAADEDSDKRGES